MEEGQGQPHDLLKPFLQHADEGALRVGHLVKELVFPEGENRDQGRSGGGRKKPLSEGRHAAPKPTHPPSLSKPFLATPTHLASRAVPLHWP